MTAKEIENFLRKKGIKYRITDKGCILLKHCFTANDSEILTIVTALIRMCYLGEWFWAVKYNECELTTPFPNFEKICQGCLDIVRDEEDLKNFLGF